MSAIIKFLEENGVTVRYAKGGWQACKCPFHSDRSASASVNTTTDRFHCFVCDINEDLIGLIRHTTGVGYVEAKQKAEEEYGACPSGVDSKPQPGEPIFGFARNQKRNGQGFQSWRSSLS